MTVTKLWLYNDCLRILALRPIETTDEVRDERFLIDDVYDDDNFLNNLLELGQWKFATRSNSVDYNPSIEPQFGYDYAFDIPSDRIRTIGFSADPYFNHPLTDYSEEGEYWLANFQTVYVRYISNGTDYGGDKNKWPSSFQKLASAQMAIEVMPLLNKSQTEQERIQKTYSSRLLDALSHNAMNDPPAFLPSGTFTGARTGYQTGWRRNNG